MKGQKRIWENNPIKVVWHWNKEVLTSEKFDISDFKVQNRKNTSKIWCDVFGKYLHYKVVH